VPASRSLSPIWAESWTSRERSAVHAVRADPGVPRHRLRGAAGRGGRAGTVVPPAREFATARGARVGARRGGV